MFIVSANYRDRNSPDRWLVRRRGEKPGEARAVPALVATGVRFCRNEGGVWEEGFGCNVVAEAEQVELVPSAPDVPASATPLKFSTATDTFRDPADREVLGCVRLLLGEHMHAVGTTA